MARKSRKSASGKRRRVPTTAPQAPTQQEAAPQGVDFAEEYRYVVNDLKRFGVLAVAMFATLIVLALTIG